MSCEFDITFDPIQKDHLKWLYLEPDEDDNQIIYDAQGRVIGRRSGFSIKSIWVLKPNILQWFEDLNINPCYAIKIQNRTLTGIIFVFENPQDALMFKLTWL